MFTSVNHMIFTLLLVAVCILFGYFATLLVLSGIMLCGSLLPCIMCTEKVDWVCVLCVDMIILCTLATYCSFSSL